MTKAQLQRKTKAELISVIADLVNQRNAAANQASINLAPRPKTDTSSRRQALQAAKAAAMAGGKCVKVNFG